MAELEITEQPVLKNSVMLAAWGGWSDAAEAATRALKEVIRQLDAKKFATIDPEEYFDFSEQRPLVSEGPDGNRVLSWPSNEFYYRPARAEGERDLVIVLGTEPHLKWRAFAAHVVRLVKELDVKLVVTVGALLDSVPHTRSPRVGGSSTFEDLGPGFEGIQYSRPTYEGPAGMTAVISDAVGKMGIPSASVWGHAPHYVQVAHNPAITHAILKEIEPFLPRPLELSRLEKESEEFEANLVQALEDQEEIQGYVKRLEERYDSEEEFRGSPEPARLVEELEDFLREERRRRPEDDEGTPEG